MISEVNCFVIFIFRRSHRTEIHPLVSLQTRLCCTRSAPTRRLGAVIIRMIATPPIAHTHTCTSSPNSLLLMVNKVDGHQRWDFSHLPIISTSCSKNIHLTITRFHVKSAKYSLRKEIRLSKIACHLQSNWCMKYLTPWHHVFWWAPQQVIVSTINHLLSMATKRISYHNFLAHDVWHNPLCTYRWCKRLSSVHIVFNIWILQRNFRWTVKQQLTLGVIHNYTFEMIIMIVLSTIEVLKI